VRSAAGRMLILSGSAAIQIENGRDPRAATSQGRRWQGVAFAIELSRFAMMKIDIRELMPPREIGRPAPGIRFE